MQDAPSARDLAWIRSLMDESQRFLCGTWRHQLVWGVIGVVSLTATWGALRTGAPNAVGWIWGAALALGWTYSLWLGRRDARAPVRNVAGRAFGGIWMALGVALTLLGTMTIMTDALDPMGLPGIVAILFGSGYFASAFLADLRWLSVVALAWWGGGVVLLLWRSPDAILALAAMTAALEAGPALLLRRIERTSRATA